MAWNSDPKVRDLGKYADKHKYQQAVVVGITEGKFHVVSYGKDADLCNKAKFLAGQIYTEIEAGNISVEE